MSHLFTALLQLCHRSEKYKWTQILRRYVTDEFIGDLSFTVWYSSRLLLDQCRDTSTRAQNPALPQESRVLSQSLLDYQRHMNINHVLNDDIKIIAIKKVRIA